MFMFRFFLIPISIEKVYEFTFRIYESLRMLKDIYGLRNGYIFVSLPIIFILPLHRNQIKLRAVQGKSLYVHSFTPSCVRVL